eukprot:g2871.t1
MSEITSSVKSVEENENIVSPSTEANAKTAQEKCALKREKSDSSSSVSDVVIGTTSSVSTKCESTEEIEASEDTGDSTSTKKDESGEGDILNPCIVKKCFELLDTNTSGALEMFEVRSAFLAMKVDEDTIKAGMIAADINADGKVSPDEFSVFLSRMNTMKMLPPLDSIVAQLEVVRGTKTMNIGEEDPLPIVFIDIPDPDNFVCVLATYVLLIKGKHKSLDPTKPVFHVVISGRPTNLSAKSLTPKELVSRLKAGEKIGDMLKRGTTEIDVLEHSTRVLEDGAVALAMFLERHGIKSSEYCIYDGGIAPSAPVSHRMHAREFLFDRSDLLEKTGKQGDTINSKEYYTLVKSLDDIEDPKKRAVETLKILRRAKRDNIFRPVTELLPNTGDRPLKLILGGPATGMKKIFEIPKIGEQFSRQIHSLHGMYGAWDNAKPGSFNLFPNQFNIAADIDAARDILIRQRQPYPMYFVPTETCKDPRLSITPDALTKALGNEAYSKATGTILNMYELWYNIQGRRPFFIFDMAPVLSASKTYGSIYTMVNVNASYGTTSGVMRISAVDGESSSEEEKTPAAAAATTTTARLADGESKTPGECTPEPILMATKELAEGSIQKYFTALAEVFATIKIES